jgi:DNA-binding NarL/FixJ family response regulator
LVRVLVADDSPVFVEAAVAVVEATPGFEVAATCRSEARAVEIAREVGPDLVLLDESMSGDDPAEAAREIAAVSPQTFVILVSADPRPFDGTVPLVDKRQLSPATLANLWRERSSEGDGRRPTGQT